MDRFDHRVSNAFLTVIAVDERGEEHDLNAGGDPCHSADDLRAFIRELHEQGAYTAATRDRLLSEVE